MKLLNIEAIFTPDLPIAVYFMADLPIRRIQLFHPAALTMDFNIDYSQVLAEYQFHNMLVVAKNVCIFVFVLHHENYRGN